MIGRLTGIVDERLPDGSCVLDVAGVGYEVWVPLGTLGRLPGPPDEVTLHVHTHVREDAMLLYGFARSEDRAAFRTLLLISGIGPKLALAILGAMDARQLASAIASQDKARFKGIPGVGKRTTERLLLELRDKLGFVSAAPMAPPGAAAKPSPAPSAEGPLPVVASLLVSMGFKPQEADRAIAKIAPESDGKSVEELMKLALGSIG